ncbi:MAG TPA: DUF1800 domain-containing protein [Bryobacteraceae bacterium]|nr:DUF1800 domain-containing protein [Bryobacteraceae bacterium]
MALLRVLIFVLSALQAFAQVTTVRAAARLLDQATWGPTPASIAQVQAVGIPDWIAGQFALNTSDLPDQPILGADGKPNRLLAPVEQAFFENAVMQPDQLRQRVAFALSQIWVVAESSGVNYAYAFPPYWRIFRDGAFGNYRDIIRNVTLSPAMGRFLDMANNVKADPAKNTAANENYARELMQLFTLGLTQLNPDGSATAMPTPTPTYDQTVVTNMAKALTGWTYPTAPGARVRKTNPPYYFGQMFAVESEHDTSAKTIFANITIPAGQTAEQDLESVLDALMAQPTMAPFVCQQLIEHLVTSNPSPQYVERVSSVFTDDGTGVRGNLKAVITAILMDPEARAGDDPNAEVSPAFGHMREPILFMMNLLRGLNAKLGPKSAIYADASLMGESLFHAPSVFSYFSPQYRIAGGLLGPEFQIYTTATATTRANLVNALLYAKLDKSTVVDLSPFERTAAGTTWLVNYIAEVFFHGSMSSDLETAVTDAVNLAAQNSTGDPLAMARAGLYVALTSGEYQIIR